jgi:hypothetical protein
VAKTLGVGLSVAVGVTNVVGVGLRVVAGFSGENQIDILNQVRKVTR